MRCYKDAPYYFTLTDTFPSSFYASVLFGKQEPQYGGGGPRYVELVVKPYPMEIDSI